MDVSFSSRDPKSSPNRSNFCVVERVYRHSPSFSTSLVFTLLYGVDLLKIELSIKRENFFFEGQISLSKGCGELNKHHVRSVLNYMYGLKGLCDGLVTRTVKCFDCDGTAV